jgi:hypothetical protein
MANTTDYPDEESGAALDLETNRYREHTDVPAAKRPAERADLYEDDLTDERYPTPAQRDELARTQIVDD